MIIVTACRRGSGEESALLRVNGRRDLVDKFVGDVSGHRVYYNSNNCARTHSRPYDAVVFHASPRRSRRRRRRRPFPKTAARPIKTPRARLLTPRGHSTRRPDHHHRRRRLRASELRLTPRPIRDLFPVRCTPRSGSRVVSA